MARPKIPRKSTFIDMTAMCDVAFLLLSFFILATKTKPPEALTVQPPGSVSSKAAPDRAFLFTVTPDSRIFLTIGEDTKKKEILEFLNKEKNLQLSPQEMTKWQKAEFYALPFNMVKNYIASGQDIPAAKMPGIPVDSTNNELADWIRSISTAYAGTDQRKLQEMLLVKGDGEAFYPVFKRVKQAFKKNDIYKFRIVTTGETVPVGTELYRVSQEKTD
jgi:biopolymer transport protein ExbD